LKKMDKDNIKGIIPPSADKATPKFDVAIIGGGAVGLATAMSLATDYRLSLVVVEAENRLTAHQTGNNSGVIHSGLYYKPTSLKAKLCVEGQQALYRFCEARGIPHEKCGKIIVATDPGELSALEELQRRGIANGLKGLRRLSGEEIREYEPHVAGVAGLWVGETGIVDYRQVAAHYADVVRAQGGEVLTGARVHAVTRKPGGLIVQTTRGDLECSGLINCAGLQSDRIAGMCGLQPQVRIIPFRGEYHKLAPKAERLIRNLVYPVPNPELPFLGVHFTRMIGGGVEAGPNAVLALARHGYSWRDVNVRDLYDILAFPGFWKVCHRYCKTGFGEIHRSLSKPAFCKALQRLVPEIEPEDLEHGGAGVRAQAIGRNGAMVDDFHIQCAERMIHVLNAPSPAATASIAIGRYIAESALSVFAIPQPHKKPRGAGIWK
jgi:L-2-hydroxyglutarate oxidase